MYWTPAVNGVEPAEKIKLVVASDFIYGAFVPVRAAALIFLGENTGAYPLNGKAVE